MKNIVNYINNLFTFAPITKTVYLTMNIKFKSGLLSLVFIMVSGVLCSQNLPELRLKTLKNDTLEFLMKAYMHPSDNLYGPNNGVIDQFEVVDTEGNLKTYNVKYVPHPDFTGKDTVIIEYRGYPGSSIMDWHIKKMSVYIEVSNSIIKAGKDILFSDLNADGLVIDVLANDSTTGDSLFLDRVFNLSNCDAYVTDDNMLHIEAFQGFTGTAFLNYVISDEFGSSTTGHILLLVNDDLSDTLDYYVTNTNYLSFFLDGPDYEVSGELPALGELDLSNDPEIVYTPDVDAEGIEIFTLSNGDASYVIRINVIESEIKPNLVIDDKVYTPVNTEITFNVSDNDFKKNSYITSFTQPEHGTLQHQGMGVFTYTPDSEFQGFDDFTYTRQINFAQYQTAKVDILVSDFLPYNNLNYKINIPKNKEFVLNYEVPIEGYTFELNTALDNGSIEFFNEYANIIVNCEDVSGKNLIVYTPETDFTGNTTIELKYCAPNNNCNVIKIDLNIIDASDDSDCYCAAYKCIWEGDADNNGIVNMKDLLPIGRYAGYVGEERSHLSDDWVGLIGDEWNEPQWKKYDLKHVDTDGDGFISDHDTLSIVENYNKVHNLYFDGTTEKTKFPIYIISEQTEVDSGELFVFYVSAGDEEYVAKDITAISYIIQIEPSLVDSASMFHYFYTDSWLGRSSSSMQLSRQTFKGQMEAALSRVGNHGVSGVGIISKSGFIIVDDLDGLKREVIDNTKIPVKIKITNITALTESGSIVGFEDAETTVFLRLKGADPGRISTEVNVFPNPASEEVQLYIDGDEKIASYRIYNMLGMTLENRAASDQRQININTRQLSNGFYFIEVITDRNNRIVKKLEILK